MDTFKIHFHPVDPILLTMAVVQKQSLFRMWNAVGRCIDYHLANNCVLKNISFELYTYDGKSGPSMWRSAIVEAL